MQAIVARMVEGRAALAAGRTAHAVRLFSAALSLANRHCWSARGRIMACLSFARRQLAARADAAARQVPALVAIVAARVAAPAGSVDAAPAAARAARVSAASQNEVSSCFQPQNAALFSTTATGFAVRAAAPAIRSGSSEASGWRVGPSAALLGLRAAAEAAREAARSASRLLSCLCDATAARFRAALGTHGAFQPGMPGRHDGDSDHGHEIAGSAQSPPRVPERTGPPVPGGPQIPHRR